MSGFWGGLLRWLIVVVMLVATAWPDIGVAAQVFQHFPSGPFWWGLGGLLWVMALSMFLPLPLRWFQVVSTVMLTGMEVATAFKAAEHFPGLFSPAQTWIVWGALMVAIPIGWVSVSARLWRWTSGIVPVQDTAAPPHS